LPTKQIQNEGGQVVTLIYWESVDLAKVLLPAAPFILVSAIPIFWLLRHVSRMFVDNLSDSRDASLRAAMTETFLSLANTPEAKIGDPERAIFLQALYRPGASQQADDSVPHPLVDVLAEMKRKG
jgi:hypothetical protein